ncbi:MAG TPA: hypothetical protein VFX92_05020 [Candidatus Krumholzibacteria bacterium]|nr:hypothetical protein [Candidatus Krumholzibacteria bacterium]
MHLVSRILTLLFDGLLLPFGSHRLVALLVLSVVSGAAFAILFKATSNQDGIRRARDVFKARVLEMRIYPDDIVQITRALLGALASQGTYLRVALKPILIVLVVALPVFIQIEARFAHAPLRAGDRTLVTATLKEGLDPVKVPSALTASTSIDAEPESVRIPATREVVWRAGILDAGTGNVTVTVYDRPYTIPVALERNTSVIGTRRAAHGFADALLHPGLPVIPADSPIAHLRIAYPEATYRLAGTTMNWLVVFLIGSFVGALLPAWILRIQL